MESERLAPFRLAPWFSERPWGRLDLRPWYGPTGKTEPVGEAWLTGPQCVVETGALKGRTLAQAVAEEGERLVGVGGRGDLRNDECAEFPLLVKLLFPSEKLSVQVHPDDAMAQELGQPRGKTECWYVVEAEPGAAIALGLREGVTKEAVQAAAEGVHRVGMTMEELLEWVPVTLGEMVFVDAGTVHAIGPGVVLLETQQTSDTTFRLYDYGRGRELHLEKGLRAMKTRTAAGKVQPRTMDGFIRLIEQKYFVVDRYDVAAGGEAIVPVEGPGCMVGLRGDAVVKSAGCEEVELPVGRAVVVPAGDGAVRVKSSVGAGFVNCWPP
jgi:mannose-6-phosphate isomerase